MEYHFRVDIAQKYGVSEAIFLHNLYFWIAKNEANGRHYYDGKNWTYNSTKAMTTLFPFWSTDQINRLVKKMESNGLVLIGNFNQAGFDRTRWFALSDEIMELFQREAVLQDADAKSQSPVAKSPNGDSEIATPIPDSKPDNKQHIENTPIAPILKTDAWNDFVAMRKTIKKPLSERARKMALNKLEELAPGDIETQKLLLDQSTYHCWQDIYPLKQEKAAPAPHGGRTNDNPFAEDNL